MINCCNAFIIKTIALNRGVVQYTNSVTNSDLNSLDLDGISNLISNEDNNRSNRQAQAQGAETS